MTVSTSLPELLDLIAARGSPCRDRLDAWFVTDPDGVAAAIDACESCPVLDACSRYTEDARPTYGVWAGRFYHPPGSYAAARPRVSRAEVAA